MSVSTEHIEKLINTLKTAFELMNEAEDNIVMQDIYRAACIKEFEIILEQSGKLLKKVLKNFFAKPDEVDELYFKNIFRHSAKHKIISDDAFARWLEYRDSRNKTAHEYGADLAEKTIKLLPKFISDAEALVKAIKNNNNKNSGKNA